MIRVNFKSQNVKLFRRKSILGVSFMRNTASGGESQRLTIIK